MFSLPKFRFSKRIKAIAGSIKIIAFFRKTWSIPKAIFIPRYEEIKENKAETKAIRHSRAPCLKNRKAEKVVPQAAENLLQPIAV